MADKLSKLAKDLEPFIVQIVRGTGGGAGTRTTGTLPTHALSQHTGTLQDNQAPQFLKVDGSRTLTGNLPVASGVLIDGVDIDVHAADPDAHHNRATGKDGISVNADQEASIVLRANSGLEVDATGLTLGTPGLLSVISQNAKLNNIHWHAILHSNNVGETPAASILSSDSNGRLVLASMGLWGNLDFIGGDREITGTHNLTLTPAVDLVLDPDNAVILPETKIFRTPIAQDLPTGITGFQLWDRGGNYRQLTIGAIKADELYVRVFVADETRIDRGEEYWSKSYGIVAEDFTLPADEATVDVWFEDSPGLPGAPIFSPGDWLLCRIINMAEGLVVQRIWFEVENVLPDGYVQLDPANNRQQWRLRRKVGGWDVGLLDPEDNIVKAGNVMLDAGQLGQGWVHLSALKQDGGPFIQVGKMTGAGTATTAPVFSNYARFGNLIGVGGDGTERYGIAGAKDLSVSFGSGFEGFVLDDVNGLRLWNTDLALYKGTSQVARMWPDGFWLRHSNGVTNALSVYTGTGSFAAGGKTLNSGDVMIGTTSGGYLFYDSSAGNLEVKGTITIVGSVPHTSVSGLGTLATANSVSWTTQVTNRPAELTDGRIVAGLNASGDAVRRVIPGTNIGTPGGAGLYLGADKMGYYNGSKWKTYMDNTGKFFFAGAGNAGIAWDGTDLYGYNGATTQWSASSVDGMMYAGGNRVRLSADGLMLVPSTTMYGVTYDPSAIVFQDYRPGGPGASHVGAIYGYYMTTPLPQRQLVIQSHYMATYSGSIALRVGKAADDWVQLRVSTTGVSINSDTSMPSELMLGVANDAGAGSNKRMYLHGNLSANNQYFTGDGGTAQYDSVIRSDDDLWVGTYNNNAFHLMTGNRKRMSVTGSGVITFPNANFGGWTAVSYAAGWSSFGSGYRAVQYRKVGDRVQMRGMAVQSGGTNLICTLPEGFRPATHTAFAVYAGSGIGRIDVMNDGRCLFYAGAGGTGSAVSFDTIEFSTN